MQTLHPQLLPPCWSARAPVVLMMQISMAPSLASSGNASFKRSRVWYACASASGDPRVPILTGTRGFTSACARTHGRRAPATRRAGAANDLHAELQVRSWVRCHRSQCSSGTPKARMRALQVWVALQCVTRKLTESEEYTTLPDSTNVSFLELCLSRQQLLAEHAMDLQYI